MLQRVLRAVRGCSLLALGLGPAACRTSDRAELSVPVCEQKGTLYIADDVKTEHGSLSIRAVHGGCDSCAGALEPGAAAGATCQVHRVCAETCCECPARARYFKTRVCSAGLCAPREAACASTLARFGSELCGAPPP